MSLLSPRLIRIQRLDYLMLQQRV